jgi:predicted phosphate transport protein (TIGR00153 family)|tara:strand:- start:395 stop:1054 length:660 start_codon:yes stop_codon:yes gene_type:complete
MFFKNTKLLSRTKKLEIQIEEFLDKVTESTELFSIAFKVYLAEGVDTQFEEFMNKIQATEREGDELRRQIETELYERTLIPDLRSDVIWLIENMDKLTNTCKANLFRLSIQQPEIPDKLRATYIELIDITIDCVDKVVFTARNFFEDHESVADLAREVALLETKADEVSSPLQRRIFDSDLDLSQKMQLRYFVEHFDELANQSEDIADQLAISAIKRRI